VVSQSNATRIMIVVALAFALTANISGVLINGVRGRSTCREVEALKAPEYKLAKENLKSLVNYKIDMKRIFGDAPTIDPVTGDTIPRWQVEYNKSFRISQERISRYAPHQCKLLFWDA